MVIYGIDEIMRSIRYAYYKRDNCVAYLIMQQVSLCHFQLEVYCANKEVLWKKDDDKAKNVEADDCKCIRRLFSYIHTTRPSLKIFYLLFALRSLCLCMLACYAGKTAEHNLNEEKNVQRKENDQRSKRQKKQKAQNSGNKCSNSINKAIALKHSALAVSLCTDCTGATSECVLAYILDQFIM